jgi:hypothetical protein
MKIVFADNEISKKDHSYGTQEIKFEWFNYGECVSITVKDLTGNGCAVYYTNYESFKYIVKTLYSSLPENKKGD